MGLATVLFPFQDQDQLDKLNEFHEIPEYRHAFMDLLSTFQMRLNPSSFSEFRVFHLKYCKLRDAQTFQKNLAATSKSRAKQG